MTEFEVRVDNGFARRFTGHVALVDAVEQMIAALDTELERVKARLLLKRRLNHPEVVGLGGGAPHIEPESRIHPKPGTRLAAHEGGPVCVCGAARSRHDIDGQRDDCDGYIEQS